jgi:hypothetical protein
MTSCVHNVRPFMAGDDGRWLRLANELAETGRYRNVAEVGVALKAKEPQSALPDNKVALNLIDSTCFRVRREMGRDT